MPSSRPQPVARRALTLLIAGLVMAGQLGALVHEADTRHVRCRHGELIDVAQARESAVASTGRIARTAGLHDADIDGDGHHVHCALVACSLVARPAPAMPVHFVVPPATRELVALAPVQAPSARQSIYRTAPKTSPPA